MAIIMARCWSVVTVEPVTFLTFFGTALMDIISQKYIYKKIGKESAREDDFSSKLDCYNDTDEGINIQASFITAGYWLLYINLASLLVAVPSTILLGIWSETEGRKVVLIASLLGTVLRAALFIIIVQFQEPLYFFVITSLITSTLGYNVSFMASCMATIADVTSNRQRTFQIVFLDSAAGFGIGMAYFFSGFYMECDWFQHFLWLVVVLCILNIIFVVCLVEETNDFPIYRPATIFSCSDFANTCRVFSYEPGNGRRWRLLTFAAVFVMSEMIIAGTNNLIILYAQTSLCFSVVLTGHLFGALCLRIIPSLFGLKLLQTILKVSNNWIIEAGFVSCFAGLILAVFSTSARLLFIVPALQLLGVLPLAVMKATMSKLVEPQEQGALFAVVSCLETSSSVLGVFLFRRLYDLTSPILPGLSFVIGALLLIVPAILVGIVQRYEDPTSEILLYSGDRSSDSDFGRQCSISRNSTRTTSFPVLPSGDLNGYGDSVHFRSS